MSIIAAGTTITTALSSTGNTDGTLQFQVNGTTPSVTLNTLGAIGVGSTPDYGTSGQVLISGGSTVAPAWGSGGASLTANNNWTGKQTFSGTSSVAGAKIVDVLENATISATAATGTINYDVTTQAVLYYTSNASANWTVNFRGSSGTSLNTLMATGESLTVAFFVTQGSTAYYNNAVTIDGSSVTPKYQGGTAWSAGNASSIDAYTYTIVKTGSAAFTVFAAQTKFA